MNSSKNISRSTLEKIQEVSSMGVKITVCSGRIPYMQQAYVHELGIQGPYVGCNGGLVVNSVDDAIIFSKTIDADVLERLSAFSPNLDLPICLQTMDKVYFTRGNPRTRSSGAISKRLQTPVCLWFPSWIWTRISAIMSEARPISWYTISPRQRN